jgi:solute carrier family 25 (mitochondrial dicarboxylate transporter), member 10
MKQSARDAAKPSRPEANAVIRYPFWFGGSASSMAACVTHPLDLSMSQRHVLFAI